MDLAIVPIKIPIDVVANKLSATPPIKSNIDPSIGTCSKVLTTSNNETPDAISTTSPMDHIFDIMISNGVNGITIKCSTVPCSRSRIYAAPVKTIDNIVILLIIAITEPNHDCVKLGLKRILTSKSTGKLALLRYFAKNSLTSPNVIFWI